MPLSIRNLTSTPLTLEVAECFEAISGDDRLRKLVVNAVHDVSARRQSRKAAKKIQRGENHTPKKEDIDLWIEPFQTSECQSPFGEKGKAIAFRLALSSSSDKWKLDLRVQDGAAERLHSPANTGRSLYGLSMPGSGFLTIFEDTNLATWMDEHSDDTPLSALSIPGTHNSPTCFKALPSVRCQAVSPKEQLENGVRFFDVRVQVDSPGDKQSQEFTLVHAVFPISFTGTKKFSQLYQDIKGFLKANPSETVVLSMKREGTGSATDADLAQRLLSHYTNDRVWYSTPSIPTLGEVRGRIVLFRRFTLGEKLERELRGKFGIDASIWADNSPNSRSGNIQVQDFYQVLATHNIEKKTQYICDHCDRAGGEVVSIDAAEGMAYTPPLYVNFLSASNFWKPGCWPDKIAAKINPAVMEYLCTKHNAVDKGRRKIGCTGILVCDFVGHRGNWDLVKVIVGMNSQLFTRH